MHNKKPYPIYFFFTKNKKLSKESFYLEKIKNHSLMLLKITCFLKFILPFPLKYKFRVLNIKNKILFLETSNSAWMTRLKFESIKILFLLKSKILPSLSYIDIKINPDIEIKSIINNKINIYNLKNNKKNKIYNNKKITKKSIKSILYVSRNNKNNLSIVLKRIANIIKKNI
ncbi:DciA family protein [Sodalis-like secondary symbiont of Drepanosiphum platanoidis]|uniref:DciA family protein n=1 Tax=Sodalis-like secondary symbiont of Drepanosiphum platanoidis TaxID=2994493 RepID=UPI003463C280